MKLISISILITALFLGMMSFMFYTGNKIITTYEPLIEASKDLKFEATQAHLWFEEILSGDSHENIFSVWQHLDLADSYAQAMLEGQVIKGYRVLALTDKRLREEVLHVRKNLDKFRNIAEYRYKLKENSSAGSAIDQKFDKVFQQFILDATRVEKSLHKMIQKDLAEFRRISFFLIALSALLATITTGILLNNRKKIRKQLSEIYQSKLLIENNSKELEHMAHYDFLTGLANRALFTELLKTATAIARRSDQWLVLLFIDLDKFKSVNDSLGHHMGDQLLQKVAARLLNLAREEDNVARLSGDEFTILLAPNSSKEEAIDSARQVAKKIQTRLSEAFKLENIDFAISASIGIALYPKDGTCAESLLKNADRSMYEVKQEGKNNFRFFSAELEHSTQRRLQLEIDLRKAIEHDELELYYQPQWKFKTGQLFGLEALIRWNHPREGVILPDEFIVIAESCGLIHQLDMWVFEAACKQLKQWGIDQVSPKQVSVNLSAIQFSKPGLVRDIAGILAEYQIDPDKMELEIVESILMNDSDHTLSTLSALKNLGVRIAVDNFGTGYSTMAYLSKFSLDTLKIDQSFVKEIDLNVAARIIIESIIRLATKLGLNCVAGGIETAEQNRFLAYHECTFAQGNFYNRPMSVEEINVLLYDEVSIDLVKQDKIAHLFSKRE